MPMTSRFFFDEYVHDSQLEILERTTGESEESDNILGEKNYSGLM